MFMQEVFKAADVPVEFEEFWISEVQDRCSDEDLDEMIASVSRNKVAIKGRFREMFYYSTILLLA